MFGFFAVLFFKPIAEIETLASQHDNTGRPIVLLNRTDVDAELSTLSKRVSSMCADEEKWASRLRARIGDL